jgi:hypothetical protein
MVLRLFRVDGVRCEFCLLSSADHPACIELIYMLFLRHAEPNMGLRLGSVVDIGAPLVRGSALSCLLVSVPYPLGGGLEWLETPNGIARVAWLLPISAAEAAYAKSVGLDGLEQLLEESNVDYLDLNRGSAV